MIKSYKQRLTYYKVFFFCFWPGLIFFLAGCARQKILMPDTQKNRRVINKISYNYQKIEDLSGYVTLNIKMGDKQIIQRGHFFYKKPDLLKINFIGWLGIPRAVFLINRGIKIYLYSERETYNISNSNNISFFNVGKKFLSGEFKIFKETWKCYILCGENKKLWVDKRKLVITRIETFDENKKIVNRTDFKIFKKTDKIFVPHKIRVQIFNSAQVKKMFSCFTGVMGDKEFDSLGEKIDILIYLRKAAVNKRLKDEMFKLPQTSLQITP